MTTVPALPGTAEPLETGSLEESPHRETSLRGTPLRGTYSADPRPLVRRLDDLIRSTAEDAGDLAREAAAERRRIEAEFQEERQRLLDHLTSANQVSELEVQTARKYIATHYDTDRGAAQDRLQVALEQITSEADTAAAASVDARRLVRWEAATLHEAAKKGIGQRAEATNGTASAARQELVALKSRATLLLARWRMDSRRLLEHPRASAVAMDSDAADASPPERAAAALVELENLRTPGWFVGFRPHAAVATIALILAGPLAWLTGGRLDRLLPALALLTPVIAGGLLAWLRQNSLAQVAGAHARLVRATAQAERQIRRRARRALRACRQELDASRVQKRAACAEADATLRKLAADVKRRRKDRLRSTNETYLADITRLTHRRDVELRRAEDEYTRTHSERKREHELNWHVMHDRYRAAAAETDARELEVQAEIQAAWHGELAALRAYTKEIEGLTGCRVDASAVEGGSTAAAGGAGVPTEVVNDNAAGPRVIRFGALRVSGGDLAAGLDLPAEYAPPEWDLPACLAFPERFNLLVRARGSNRPQAIQVLQTAMLRMLAAFPAGKLRFTLIDPVSLGQDFAAFMHLADEDEALVNGRIWTEAVHIEERLADLTEQMETVIQKYLRNEFASIAEYNAQAGEIAEPLRVLVIAGFPVRFTENAARRLRSILQSGSRCGVYSLIAADDSLPLPPGLTWDDLTAVSETLRIQDGIPVWQDEALRHCELRLDAPPDAASFTEQVRRVGRAARAATRVMVPFERIAPAEGAWWQASATAGIRVPLGPAGATRQLHLELGQGTAQHVLVAGKTGSGKSSLWHALITNLSLWYSPDEIQLYLVDFKKGVEFKTYATHRLPHATVIAVESDREFGLSVLERLDQELKSRGDAFRSAGVPDLESWRREPGRPNLPRVLLIVDEFQEFFVEDDRLAQEATLLLDRLVRQGRAFGIHILLGSQTLGGAYSLARSTLGQMAIRIALQCSETDAHLILGEDNSAARLLSRPGEAIYNPAGGRLEANHPFQVAWLSEGEREGYLRALATRGGDRPSATVFEGNISAELSSNRELAAAARGEFDPAAAPRLWVGDPVAIRGPTAVVINRVHGENLLVIGQQETAALGVLEACLVSVAAQTAAANPQPPRVWIAAEGEHGSGAYAALAERLPIPCQGVGRALLPGVLAELLGEIALRTQAANSGRTFPNWWLVLHDLARWRDLRRSDDDFNFTSGGPETPASQFARILRDGPLVGVHVLAWCDSLATLNRLLERATQREFAHRVLFQMGANDSSHLIDTPAASRLGIGRALYSDEAHARLEKFRPYVSPDLAWVEHLLMDRPPRDGWQ